MPRAPLIACCCSRAQKVHLGQRPLSLSLSLSLPCLQCFQAPSWHQHTFCLPLTHACAWGKRFRPNSLKLLQSECRNGNAHLRLVLHLLWFIGALKVSWYQRPHILWRAVMWICSKSERLVLACDRVSCLRACVLSVLCCWSASFACCSAFGCCQSLDALHVPSKIVFTGTLVARVIRLCQTFTLAA